MATTGNSCFWLADFFKNRPIRNKNCLWQPCLLMDRDEMSNLYRGASYQASEEKIKMWKVNGRQTTDAMWWQKLTLPLARWAKNIYNVYTMCIQKQYCKMKLMPLRHLRMIKFCFKYLRLLPDIFYFSPLMFIKCHMAYSHNIWMRKQDTF